MAVSPEELIVLAMLLGRGDNSRLLSHLA